MFIKSSKKKKQKNTHVAKETFPCSLYTCTYTGKQITDAFW